MILRRWVPRLLGALLLPTVLAAQGTLSSQGFGYPTGQVSAHALGTAGALAPFDPASPINPAALAGLSRSAFTVQLEPEYRTVSPAGGGRTERTDTQRLPLLAAGLRFGRGRFALGVAASTFLDRSWATTSTGTARIGTETLPTIDRASSRGAIADLRFAFAWNVHRTVRVGAAYHALTGENVVVQARTFGDSAQFGGITDSTLVGYRGLAGSVGVEWTPVRGVGLAAHARRGGDIETYTGSTVRSRATVPAREGIALRVDRFAGLALLAAVDRTRWTDLRSLGSPRMSVHDATTVALGTEVQGPAMRGRFVQFRGGWRTRDLPFGVDGNPNPVGERAWTAGVGLPVAGPYADLDLGLQRATRRATGLGTERAWTIGVAVTVRP
jgi:hypothetical protein